MCRPSTSIQADAHLHCWFHIEPRWSQGGRQQKHPQGYWVSYFHVLCERVSPHGTQSRRFCRGLTRSPRGGLWDSCSAGLKPFDGSHGRLPHRAMRTIVGICLELQARGVRGIGRRGSHEGGASRTVRARRLVDRIARLGVQLRASLMQPRVRTAPSFARAAPVEKVFIASARPPERMFARCGADKGLANVCAGGAPPLPGRLRP